MFISLTWAIAGINLSALVLIHITIFLFSFYSKFKKPPNLKKHRTNGSFENKFLLTFKDQPRWARIARLYPGFIWSPIGKKRCILETNPQTSELQRFILNNSYEIQLIERLNTKLAKKFNLS
jgi:hypothetical protein